MKRYEKSTALGMWDFAAYVLSEARRIMSIDEILFSSDLYGIDFVGQKMIPCIDCFDNDFIVFDLNAMKWTSFNIVDEISFGDEYAEIEDLIDALLD